MMVSWSAVQGGVSLVKRMTSHPFYWLVGMTTVQAFQPLPIRDPAERKMNSYQETMRANYPGLKINKIMESPFGN